MPLPLNKDKVLEIQKKILEQVAKNKKKSRRKELKSYLKNLETKTLTVIDLLPYNKVFTLESKTAYIAIDDVYKELMKIMKKGVIPRIKADLDWRRIIDFEVIEELDPDQLGAKEYEVELKSSSSLLFSEVLGNGFYGDIFYVVPKTINAVRLVEILDKKDDKKDRVFVKAFIKDYGKEHIALCYKFLEKKSDEIKDSLAGHLDILMLSLIITPKYNFLSTKVRAFNDLVKEYIIRGNGKLNEYLSKIHLEDLVEQLVDTYLKSACLDVKVREPIDKNKCIDFNYSVGIPLFFDLKVPWPITRKKDSNDNPRNVPEALMNGTFYICVEKKCYKIIYDKISLGVEVEEADYRLLKNYNDYIRVIGIYDEKYLWFMGLYSKEDLNYLYSNIRTRLLRKYVKILYVPHFYKKRGVYMLLVAPGMFYDYLSNSKLGDIKLNDYESSLRDFFKLYRTKIIDATGYFHRIERSDHYYEIILDEPFKTRDNVVDKVYIDSKFHGGNIMDLIKRHDEERIKFTCSIRTVESSNELYYQADNIVFRVVDDDEQCC